MKQGQESGDRNGIYFYERTKMKFCFKQNDALPSLRTIIAALTFHEQTLCERVSANLTASSNVHISLGMLICPGLKWIVCLNLV